MNIGLYMGASALGALERWQEAISHNIASGSAPGYRKREVPFSVDNVGQIPFGLKGENGKLVGAFPNSRIEVNFTPGEIFGTGRDLDVAIQGEGFFEVQLPNGERGYTRAGNFHVNAERTIVDSQGNPILSDGGSPITLLADGGPLAIARDGTVSQGSQVIGRLGLQRFENPQKLETLSGGLFRAPEGTLPQPVVKPFVQQGALEASNVNPVTEMVNLIRVTRTYQAAQKVITTQDENMERALRALT